MTDAGAEMASVEIFRVTKAPPVGAAAESLIVQLVELPPVMVEGVQTSEDIEIPGLPVPVPAPVPPVPPVDPPETVIDPPVPVAARGVPVGSTPVMLMRVTGAVVETFAKVIDATTPFAMVVEFMPESRQVRVPPPKLLQETVFPAAVAVGPAEAVTDPAAAEG